MENRRWYDKDPILREALDLLKLSPAKTKDEAAEFILQLQNQVASEVLEHVYDMMEKYEGKGNRWYDSDPVMLKAIEMLRMSSPKTQRIAALKLLLALENNTLDSSDSTEHE